ncbi:hypothetical protein QA597_09000 [Marinilabiliaceae bacterium ANBcel2]|nr:hypothetical protein [Marinilabiliaceae bacterium ANBcel2]
MDNRKKNIILYSALTAASLIIIAVTLLYYYQNREMTQIVNNLTEEKHILTEEYQNLILNYDSLQSDNDTLNEILAMERQRVEHLVEEIKTIRATNTAKIREYQQELVTLRGVLQSYVAQIDSLNQRNEELTRENIEHRQRYAQIESSYKNLQEVKTDLEEKVTIASKLEVAKLEADGLTSSGRTTNRSRRAEQIRVCFTLLKNVTTPVGMKDIYLRVERPDGQLLMHSRDDLFEYEESEINFSAKRTVEYGGEEMEVCIYYDADAGELTSGEYTADLFADGFHIASHIFSLR